MPAADDDEAEGDPISEETRDRPSMLERLLIGGLQGAESDWVGRARLLLGAAGVSLAAAGVGLVWNTTLGPRENAPIVVGIFLGTLLVPWMLRWTRSLSVGANVLNAVLFAGLLGLIINTNGQTLPPYMLLPSLPLLASLIAGGRSGLFWSAMAFVGLGVAYTVSPELGGVLAPTELMSPDLVSRGKFFGSAQMLGVVTALSVTEWRLRRDSLRALSAANQLSQERYRQLLEQQTKLEEARVDEAELRDRFFSHISHELRTPLTPLHQFLTLVLDEVAGPLSSEQREYLEVALRNTDQLKKLIGDVTEAARLQSDKVQLESSVVELGALVRNSLSGFENEAAKKDLSLSLIGNPELRAYCDPKQAQRVLHSLLENAISFAPESSTVEIRIEHDPTDSKAVRIAVADAGPGVDPEARERIFEGLAPQKAEEWESRQGLGLGLFIARTLVKRLQGRLWLESEKGEGATFLFSLPRYDLSSLVRSVMLADQEPVEELGLLVLRIHSAESELSPCLHRAVAQELRVVLFPHADVVLPAAAPGVPSGCHVALTRTNRETLPRLIERMAGHFRRFGPVCEIGAEISFEGVIVTFDHDHNRDVDATIAEAAVRIDVAIRGLAGTSRHEPDPPPEVA